MIRRDVIHPVFKARNAHTLGLQLTTPSHPSHWSRAPVRFQLPAFYFFLLCFVFYSLDLFTSFYVCGCFCQHVCLVPKWVLDSLELELQMVVSHWVRETEPGFSERAISSVNHWSISLVSRCQLIIWDAEALHWVSQSTPRHCIQDKGQPKYR